MSNGGLTVRQTNLSYPLNTGFTNITQTETVRTLKVHTIEARLMSWCFKIQTFFWLQFINGQISWNRMKSEFNAFWKRQKCPETRKNLLKLKSEAELHIAYWKPILSSSISAICCCWKYSETKSTLHAKITKCKKFTIR